MGAIKNMENRIMELEDKVFELEARTDNLAEYAKQTTEILSKLTVRLIELEKKVNGQ